MNERHSLQVSGRIFARDPVLATKGVLQDVGNFLAMRDSGSGTGSAGDANFPVTILQVQLKDHSPQDAKLALTIRTRTEAKTVVECPIRSETYDIVKQFFEQKSRRIEPENLESISMPSAGRHLGVLAGAEKVVSHVEARHEADKWHEWHAYALGNAIGISLILGEKENALELAQQLRRALRIGPDQAIKPSRTRVLLNSLASVIRAGVVGGREDAVLEIASTIIPATASFEGTLNESADLSRFSVAMREAMEGEDAALVESLFGLFRQPDLQLYLLSLSIEACIESANVAGLRTCGQVVKHMLKECQSAQEFKTTLGFRVQAFSAALSGKSEVAERLIEDIPLWERSEEAVGWIFGFSIGLRCRSKEEMAPRTFMPRLHHLIYDGNDDNFFPVCSSFVQGMLAANQGSFGARSEEILQLLSDTHPDLEEHPSFVARRFIHQLVTATRLKDGHRAEQALEDFSCTARMKGLAGDSLMLAMCEELLSDVTIRDATLRKKVIATIVGELKEKKNAELFELTRFQAGDLLYVAGFEEAALQVPPPLVVGEAGLLVWRLRRAARHVERSPGTPSKLLEGMVEKIDELGGAAESHGPALRPMKSSDWCPIIEETAALNASTLLHRALVHALAVSTTWSPREVSHLNDAILDGLVRRARNHAAQA